MNTLRQLQEKILLTTAQQRKRLFFFKIIIVLCLLYILMILGCFFQFLRPSFIMLPVIAIGTIILGIFSFLYTIFLQNSITTTAKSMANEFFFDAIKKSVQGFIYYYDPQFDQEIFLMCVAQNMKNHKTAYIQKGNVCFNWTISLDYPTTKVKGLKFTYLFQILVLVDHHTCCIDIDQENIGILFHYKKVWFHGHEAIVEDEKRIYFHNDINQGG